MTRKLPPLVLFSQADAKTLDNGLLEKMLQSVVAQAWTAPVNVYLSLNHAGPKTGVAFEKAYPFLTIRRTAGQLSLSANRNLLLREFLPQVPDDALVAFPDDDAYYNPGLLKAIVAEMEQGGFDYLATSTNDPADKHHPRFSDVPKPFDMATALDDVNSNTLFLKGKLAKQVGLFAEDFGLGTAAVGGEDNEYALRLLTASRNGVYRPQFIVGHPVKQGIGHKYYPSSILLYARHTEMMKAHVSRHFMLKRFLRGIQLVLMGKIPYKRFVSTWIRATKELLA